MKIDQFPQIAAISLILILVSCSQVPQKGAMSEMSIMKADVEYLASDELKGREFGTAGEMLAGDHIAKRFKELGLTGGGENGTFFQSLNVKKEAANPHGSVEFDDSSSGGLNGRNVLGYLDRGSDYTIIVGGHYDHLGMGQEGSLHAGGPEIHNGADDNASGIAALLSIAEALKASKVKNNVLFMAFTGEEKGLWGSNYFVKNPTIDLKSVNFMINMDMVGRLDPDRGLVINAVGTSPEWQQAIDKANKNGVKISTSESGIGPSDHTSFYLMDLPVLHFFTGAHTDYHKPTDDADKVNYQGIAQIADMIERIILELDDQKIAFTKTKDEATPSRADFKVTLGVIPDYLFDGEGMRIDGVREGRPASNAGLIKGDIVLKMGDVQVKNMESYMVALSNFEKGQQADVIYVRDGKETTVKVTF